MKHSEAVTYLFVITLFLILGFCVVGVVAVIGWLVS